MARFKIAPLFEMSINKTIFTKMCQSIGPIYYVCKIIGMAPVYIKIENKSIILKPGIRDWYYFTTYIILYSALSAYTLWCVMTDEDNYNIISQTVVIIECYIMIALKFLTLFFCFLLRKLITDSLHLIAEIDKNLLTVGITIDYNAALKRSFKIFIAMCASVTLRTILMLTTVVVDFGQQSTLFISALVKSLSKYKFIILILLVSKRFDVINEAIKYMYKKKSNVTYIEKNTTNVNKITEKLYVLCRLHYKLCHVTRLLNRAFAWQLLLSLGVSLSDILFQSYYLYVSFSGRANGVTINKIICAITWLLDEIMEIYFLVYACASTCSNANKTSVMLHELRNNYKSLKLENHVQMYSLQMLHQKLQFSALGFFVIDYSLIYSIIGAVTTYLVIFIQFDQSQLSNQIITTTPTNIEECFNCNNTVQ